MPEMADDTRWEPKPPYLIQYWDTETVPDYISGLFDTFRRHNPGLRHRIFSEAEAERFIRKHCGARELAAFRACSVPAMQADYFRYCAVFVLGGIYVDADYRCLRSLRPLVDRDESGEIFLSRTAPKTKIHGREARRARNDFFAFTPRHPLLGLAVEIATANMEARIAERVWTVGEGLGEAIWCTVGPGIFSLMRFMRDWGSFDAFIRGIAGSPAEPFGGLYCEVVGEQERVAEAFEGVRVSPYERLLHWIEVPKKPLPYKKTEAHWAHFRAPIFK